MKIQKETKELIFFYGSGMIYFIYVLWAMVNIGPAFYYIFLFLLGLDIFITGIIFIYWKGEKDKVFYLIMVGQVLLLISIIILAYYIL
jgi:hypothetical protein